MEMAIQSSAQAVTSPLDADPGPIAKDGCPARGGPHRTLRKGLAVPTASSMDVSSNLSGGPASRGRHTDNFGAHRPSKFAAATTAGPTAGERSAVGRRTSATSSVGQAPP